MTSRRPRYFLIASAVVVLGLLGLLFESRGLRVEIANATPEPLVNVELAHPGGTTRLDRIEPGSAATVRVRGPLGLPSAIPMALSFSQRGERSLPLALHCRPRSVGWRTVTLDVRETPVHRSVVVSAGMVSVREVVPDRLWQNARDPKIGPRAFIGARSVFLDRTVIPRRNWVSEFATAAAALHAPRENPVQGTITLVEYSVYATQGLIDATRGPDPRWPELSPTAPVNLPIDWLEAIRDVRSTHVQHPYWP